MSKHELTTTDIVDLLSVYGDALESTHPLDETSSETTVLGAQGNPSADPVDLIVMPVEERKTRRVLATAAIAMLACVAAVAIWTAVRSNETLDIAGNLETVDHRVDIPDELQPFVFPGETVLRTNPLVVIAAPPKELNFDTSQLGTEITFGRISDLPQDELDQQIDAIVASASWNRFDNVDLELTKLTLLWHRDSQVSATSIADGIVSETALGERSNIRDAAAGTAVRVWSSIHGPNSRSVAETIDDPGNLDDLRVPETVREHIGVDVDGGYPLGTMSGDTGSVDENYFYDHYEVAQEVAAVQMINGASSVWMRPIGGQVLLTGQDRETQIELVTYGKDGQELTRHQPFVFPGETVLRTDPLVVIAASPQELNFDTSQLGTEITFGEIGDLPQDELDQQIDELVEHLSAPGFARLANSEIRKLTLLWKTQEDTDAGPHLALIGVVDGVANEDVAAQTSATPSGSLLRYELKLGGGTISDDIANPDEPEGFRLPETVEEHLEIADAQGRYPVSGTVSVGGNEFTINYEVAREVAAVQMITEGTSVWMRPIGGQVLLTAEGDQQTQIELVTYNADGDELTRRLATVVGS